MWNGPSGSTEQDQQFRSLSVRNSTGASRPKWSKSEHSSPVVTTDLAGPPDVASSFLIFSPCQKVAII